jgi:outer membrane protein assembly factor BamB
MQRRHAARTGWWETPIFCTLALLGLTGPARADDWPQWLGPQRDGVWREQGILDRFPANGPVVRWRTPLGGGYAGPAVAEGRVYVTDRVLDKGARDPDNPFARSNSPGKERVLCLDEATGKVLWEHAYPVKYAISYPCGPRATPVVSAGRVYTLGAMGDLLCLDARKGTVLWSKNFPRDYGARVPGWGFAAHPLLDGNKLICLVGGKDNNSVAVAFDAGTGKEVWRSLSLQNEGNEIGYAPPMIYQAGGVRQLIIWHPEAVNGLDPETGKVYWSRPFRLKANLSIPTPRQAGDLLLVSSFYNGSMMLRLAADKPDAEVVWKSQGRGETPEKTDTLHSIMCTPFLRDGYIYGVCSYGELRCLRASDGKRIWEDLRATGRATKPTERWANAFLVAQGDRFFLFNEKGDLIIARLSPKGYEEIDRAHILEPTGRAGRPVVWSHPAFAEKCVFARNDKEIVCVSLATGAAPGR